MLEYEVQGRAELAAAVLAAVLAAAQPTFEQARANPVVIKLLGTNCVYKFKNGIHYARAERLVRDIAKTRKGAFV